MIEGKAYTEKGAGGVSYEPRLNDRIVIFTGPRTDGIIAMIINRDFRPMYLYDDARTEEVL